MQIIRGKIASAQRVVIYGPEGIGKSTLASQFPNPLFIDTEGSTKHMDVARTPAPSSWTMLMQQIQYVKNNPNICDTLVIDTADWAEQLCAVEICAKSNKKSIGDWNYGRGYVYLAEEFGRFLNQLSDVIEIGIHVVVTAHAHMRKFEQPDESGAYDRWELKLQKKVAPLVKEWADMVLFANYKTHVVNVDGQGATQGKNKARGGKRVMYTTHHPCWDAKNRHNLPEEINIDYKDIAHCITPRPELTGTPNQVPAKPKPNKPKSEPVQPKQEVQSELKQEEPKQMPEPEPVIEETMEEEGPEQTALPANVPKALADLMAINNVTIEEIQQVVAMRGYYPDGTPIENYDTDFINGVLVGAWEQVFSVIQENRGFSESDIPF